MACAQCCGIEEQFGDKIARKELKRYRRRGPKKTTLMLLDLIRSSNTSRNSLLDIGGGVGAIQHELATSDTESITSVDASPAYLEASRSEARARGYEDRASYISGNFVDAADTIPDADVVTMDRVICCYHDVDALLGTAAEKARHTVGLVFPREKLHVRFGMSLLNGIQTLLRKDFRAFVHPHDKVDEILAERGLFPSGSVDAFIWKVAVYRRAR